MATAEHEPVYRFPADDPTTLKYRVKLLEEQMKDLAHFVAQVTSSTFGPTFNEHYGSRDAELNWRDELSDENMADEAIVGY